MPKLSIRDKIQAILKQSDRATNPAAEGEAEEVSDAVDEREPLVAPPAAEAPTPVEDPEIAGLDSKMEEVAANIGPDEEPIETAAPEPAEIEGLPGVDMDKMASAPSDGEQRRREAVRRAMGEKSDAFRAWENPGDPWSPYELHFDGDEAYILATNPKTGEVVQIDNRTQGDAVKAILKTMPEAREEVPDTPGDDAPENDVDRYVASFVEEVGREPKDVRELSNWLRGNGPKPDGVA